MRVRARAGAMVRVRVRISVRVRMKARLAGVRVGFRLTFAQRVVGRELEVRQGHAGEWARALQQQPLLDVLALLEVRDRVMVRAKFKVRVRVIIRFRARVRSLASCQ